MDVTYTQYGKQGQILSVLNTDSLIDGNHLFYFIQYPEDKSVWNGGGFGNLINGDSMLCAARMSDTDTFDLSLENLINGNSMFNSCPELKSFSSNLTNLKSAVGMFAGCSLDATSLEHIATTINDIYDINKKDDSLWTYMIHGDIMTIDLEDRGRIGITCDSSVTEDIIAQYGEMLGNKGWLANINGKEFRSTVVWIEYDDYGNVIDADLSGLESGEDMFVLMSFDNFTYDLSSLIDGNRMFNSCSKLTTFTSKLSQLKSGHQMFSGCKLNEESVINISDSINDLVEKGLDRDNDDDWTLIFDTNTHIIQFSGRGRIDIGHDTTISNDILIECGNKMVRKGWDVYFNDVKYEYTEK